jgi:diguanylate cyclase (GGDEF)-like protein
MNTETKEGFATEAHRDRAIEIDYLTGLYNKKAITEYAIKECMAGEGKVINLCILDVDNFKQINDTRGHAYGDKILKEVSDIILEVLGEDGRAGRIGGDEMMLIIENVEERADLRVYLKAIRERVEASHRDDNGFPQVTVSMGLGTFPTYVDNYDDLFNLADRMLYRAKNRGKNRYVIYNPEIHGKIVNGELDENTAVINRATAVDKTRLVMESLEGLFDTMNEAIPALLGKIVATYDLDEAYIFYRDMDRSVHGIKRIGDSGTSTEVNVLKTIDATSDIIYTSEAGFESLFNANGVFVIDTPGVQLMKHPKALEFFEEHGIKHAFIYRMQNTVYNGYIALYNTRQITRKFPQPDITDLTYLSKMIEIAIKTR